MTSKISEQARAAKKLIEEGGAILGCELGSTTIKDVAVGQTRSAPSFALVEVRAPDVPRLTELTSS